MAAASVSTSSKTDGLTKSGEKFVSTVVTKNAFFFLIGHLLFLHSIYLILTVGHTWTFVWTYILGSISGFGITVGAHRLYSHRSFKANSIVRAFLILGQTIAGQNCMYIWVRDHRQHHKHSDTSADPHDSTRGFMFSHVGWLMMRKHPDVIRAGAHIDMSDLEADQLVMFQKKYYKPLYYTFAVVLPILVPCIFWNESLWNAFVIAFVGRYVYILNVTWLVNSAAHVFGTKPYDKNHASRENSLVAFLSWGEGWHNYHHAFPWDYRASEYGMRYNTNACFIELLAKIGWTTDLKTASKNVVMDKVALKGDGSHGAATPDGKVTTGWKRAADELAISLWHILGTLPLIVVVTIIIYGRHFVFSFSTSS